MFANSLSNSFLTQIASGKVNRQPGGVMEFYQKQFDKQSIFSISLLSNSILLFGFELLWPTLFFSNKVCLEGQF